PQAILREFKNAADRGLLSPLPHPQEKRFHKALARLFPRRAFRVYAPGTSLAGLWEAAGLPPPGLIADPALSPYPGGGPDAGQTGALSLWRPFLDEAAPLAAPEDVPVLIPLLPAAGWDRGRPMSPLILAIDPAWPAASGGAAPAPEGECPFPPSDLIPPALLATLTRGVYDLIAAGPARGKCPAKIRAVLDKGPWERRGIYLRLRESPEPAAWEGIFRRFLAGGFLIPPEPGTPLILPGLLSPGEEAKLAALLAGER
ncbi:MAG: hypothetical protein LBK02_08220, partial [Treponema sp.]|nr:hypothetical protein [Treponema sp.]